MQTTIKPINKFNYSNRLNALSLAVGLLSPLLAVGADGTWSGAASGGTTVNYWNNTTNWASGVVPGSFGSSSTSSDVATFATADVARQIVDFSSGINGRYQTIGKIVVDANQTNTDMRIFSSQATSGGNFRIDGVSGVGIDMSSAVQQFSFGTVGGGNDYKVWVQNDQSWDVTSATPGANLNVRYSDPTTGVTLGLQNQSSNTASALTLNVGSGRTAFLDGPVVGAGSLIKANSGTVQLSGTNTYDGTTTISAGTLRINTASALGSTSAGTVVESGAVLAIDNGLTLADEPLTLNGNGISQSGALSTVGTASPTTVSSPITVGSNNTRIRPANGGELNLDGPITDNGNNYNLFLHADQADTVINVNSASNQVGTVTLYGGNATRGLIRFGVDNAFPESILAGGGGLFDLNGTDQTFAGWTSGFNPQLGVVTNSSGTPSTLTINYANTSATATASNKLTGLINVVKEGAGVLSLSGGASMSHTYSGTTTVNGGVFSVNSDMSQVTNSFTVNNGGILRGSGNRVIGGPVTVNSGGILYSGFSSNSIGALTISNNLTLGNGSTVIACINPDLSTSNDVITVTGTLTYGGTLVVYSIGHTRALQVGDNFTIFPGGGSGSFSNVVFNSIETQPGTSVSFDEASGVVTVTATTAPSLDITPQGGGVMQIDWTSSFYKLQLQTNALITGLSTNWEDYYPPMTNTQAMVTVTNDPAVPSTFFRLAPKP